LVPLLRSQPVTLKKVLQQWGTFFMSQDLSGFQNLTGLFAGDYQLILPYIFRIFELKPKNKSS